METTLKLRVTERDIRLETTLKLRVTERHQIGDNTQA